MPSWPYLCTLWKTKSKWEISVNNMFFSAFQWNAQCFSVKCAVYEMRSAFHWNAQCISLKCTFHLNAQCISLKCAVKCAVQFSEMHSEMHNYMKCAVLFTEMCRISLKSVAHFSNIWWAFGFPPSIGLSYKDQTVSAAVLPRGWHGSIV